MSNHIAASSHIDDSVVLGEGNTIEPGVVIRGDVHIGDRNYFAPGVSIGGLPRQVVHGPELGQGPGRIRIGHHNYLGECVRVHAPVMEETSIGSHSSIGAGTHVGHDSRIGDHVTLSLNCTLSGYCQFLDWSGLGVACSVHPRTVLGDWSYAGAGSVILTHVFPATVVVGSPARYLRPNFIALKRSGLGQTQLSEVRRLLAGEPPSGWLLAVSRGYEVAVERFQRNPTITSWEELEG